MLHHVRSRVEHCRVEGSDFQLCDDIITRWNIGGVGEHGLRRDRNVAQARFSVYLRSSEIQMSRAVVKVAVV